MELKFDKIGNVLKITVEGRLVAACSEEFKETVSGWLDENRYILFDLSQMNHIDSSGLGALVYVILLLKTDGGIHDDLKGVVTQIGLPWPGWL